MSAEKAFAVAVVGWGLMFFGSAALLEGFGIREFPNVESFIGYVLVSFGFFALIVAWGLRE